MALRGRTETSGCKAQRCGAAPENGFAVFSRREAPLPRFARRSRPAAQKKKAAHSPEYREK
jgi:hypothetical protein